MTIINNRTLFKTTKLSQAIKKIILASSLTCLTATATKETVAQNSLPLSTIVLTKLQIQNTGLNNIGDVINELAFTRGLVINQFNNSTGDGSVSTNLGNLGTNRVLVLLNGKRMVKSTYNSYDFSGIPLSIVEKIEISRGQGLNNETDGLAGVINIITITEFNGTKVNAYYGLSERGDAETQNYNFTTSKSTEKGSLLFNIEYSKNTAISASDRTISALPLFGTGNTQGSLATPQGLFAIFSPQYTSFIFATTDPSSNGWNTANDPDLRGFNTDDRYNYAPENYLFTPQQRKSIFFKSSYQLSETVKFNSELLYNQRNAQRMLASEPLFIGTLSGGRAGIDYFDIGADNPYNPLGVDIPGSYVYLIGRRLIEAGNRKIENNVDTFHLNLGLTGFNDIGSGWDWDVNYLSSTRQEDIISYNRVDKRQVAQALSNDCVSDVNCTPLNIFGGEGSITPEMVNYIMRDTKDRNKSELDVFNAHLNSDILEMPSGPLNFDVRYQYRNNKINQNWDELYKNNASINNKYLAQSKGSYNNNEIRIKARIPLIKNTGTKALDLGVSTTYSKYDFTQGVFSGGLDLNFLATQSLQMNLSFSINRQAPSLIALFRDATPEDQSIYDPCDSNLNLPGCPPGETVHADYSISPTTLSGNDQLNLEKSELWQLNILYRPDFIENLSINTRLFKQKLSKVINKVSAQRILNACAYTGNLYCGNITRSDTSPSYITEVRSTFFNEGVIKTSGVETTLDYSLSTELADFSIIWQSAYLDQSEIIQRNYIDNSETNISFLNLELNNVELPQLKSNLNISARRNNWGINYQLRYVSGYEERCNPRLVNDLRPTSNPNAVGGSVSENFRWCTYDSADFIPLSIGTTGSSVPAQHDRRHAGGASFHDLNLSYQMPQYKTSITLGVENIFDKTPPLSVNAVANSYQTYLYNGTGRFFWLRVVKNF